MVDCHYFPLGLQLPSQPLRENCYQFRCLVNRGKMGVHSLPKTVTRQRRGCGLNPGPTAPASSSLTTQLPSHRKHRRLTFHARKRDTAGMHSTGRTVSHENLKEIEQPFPLYPASCVLHCVLQLIQTLSASSSALSTYCTRKTLCVKKRYCLRN